MADGVVTTNIGYLKEIYGPRFIEDQQQRRRFMFDSWLKRAPESDSPKGRGFFMAKRFAGNEGVGAANENQALPRPGTQQVGQPYVAAKFFYGTVQWSGPSEAIAKGDKAAFADSTEYEMKETLATLRKQCNVEMWRDGKGVVTTTTTAATGTSKSVPEPWLLRQGMHVDVVDTTLATYKVRDAKISTISQAGAVVFDKSFTTASGDKIVPKDYLDSAPSDGKTMTGLAAIVDTTTVSTTYLGLSRSTYPGWQGLRVDGTGLNITGDLLQKSLDLRQLFSNATDECEIWSHHVQRRNYLQTVTQLKRFSKLMLDAGFDTLEFNGKPWNVEVDCPIDSVWMLEHNDIQRFILEEFHWDSDTGSIRKQVDGFDAKYAYLKAYFNIAARNPNRHLRIHSLTAPSYI